MKHLTTFSLACAALVMSLPAAAAIQTRAVDYDVDGVSHVGYMAWDDATDDKRPGVLVVPEWWGLNDYAKERARQLAQAGYVAFAADMYGNGKTTKEASQASEWSSAAKPELRNLTKAALNVLEDSDHVDADHLGAIGFCFGGTSVLQLAYSGAPVDGVVSMHGHMPTPAADDDINAAILILSGKADPMVPMADIHNLENSLEQRKDLDWKVTLFPNAEHAFTNPDADSYGIEGVSYNEKAAKAAWNQTKAFLAEHLESGS